MMRGKDNEVSRMKKNILLQTNLRVCLVIAAGFLLTATLSYRANYSASLQNIEQVSALTSEGIYYQMSTTFTKPVNISLTMANDSLLKSLLIEEPERLEDATYIDTIREYLHTYQIKYGYDSVFLVSAATGRYYNFNGLDRVLAPEDAENTWYYDDLLGSEAEYTMNVDNDEVSGAGNAITVFVNCKIKGTDGTLLGVVGVGVRIDGLQQTLQTYQDQFGVNAYFIDRNGMIEISTAYSGYEKVNLFELSQVNDAEERQSILDWKTAGTALCFWARSSAGQQQDYIVARYLPELDWHLVVERDTSTLMRNLHQQILIVVAVIAVILGAILWIITCVIRRFNHTIVELTHNVEQERQAAFEKATGQLFENIYEIDITHNLPANRETEAYFESLGAPQGCPYDSALHIIAEQQIKEEFRQGYIDTFSPENVLRTYAEGTDGLCYEFMITRDGANYYWMRINARIVKLESEDALHLLVYRQNIDAEKRQQQKMHQLAQTDEMTGLLTKTATRRQVAAQLEAQPADSFAYFIFDIDNFKQVNDQFGHAFGDAVICAFVSALRRHFRRDDVLGRVGGDEFAAFVPCDSRAAAEEKAQLLCRALNRTHTSSGRSWHISASIGVAFAPTDGTDADTLFQKADAALYQTKARGKNGYTLYDQAANAQARKKEPGTNL